WDAVLVTPLSGAQLVLGYLAGRAGPVLAGVLLAIGVWIVAMPHYRALFEPIGGLSIPPGELLVFAEAMVIRLLSIGAVGIAIASRARHSGAATTVAIALTLLLLGTDMLLFASLENARAGALLFLGSSIILTSAALELARRWIRSTR